MCDSTSACADASASLTAAMTMSAEQLRVVGVDRLRVDLDLQDLAAAPVAFTVTMPPPAEPRRSPCAGSSCACCISACICCACCISLFKSIAHRSLHLVAASKVSLTSSRSPPRSPAAPPRRPRVAVLAEREREREPAAGHLVERVAGAASRSSAPRPAGGGTRRRRELERERVAVERRTGAPRAASTRSGSSVASTAGRIVRCHASWSCSSSSDGRLGARRRGRGRRRGWRLRPRSRAAGGAVAALLELLEPVRDRLAREVGAGPRHLDERELERQARVAALAHVLDGDGEQVDQPEHGRLRRAGSPARAAARASPRSPAATRAPRPCAGRAAGGAGARAGRATSRPRSWPCSESSSTNVERAGRVAVDDEVAEPEQRLLLDRAEELEHGLHGDLAARSRPRAGRASRRRRGTSRARRARRATSAASGASIPSPSATRRRQRTSSGSRGRWKTNVWQRERTVGSTFARSVVQKTKRRCGGGSSISFSSAFQAASVSWCASSRM